jgi:hypothetical protein
MHDRPFIPAWLDDFGLSQGAFRVACNLWRRLNRKTGQCNPSLHNIGNTCRMSRRQVLRALNELENRQIVTRCKQGYGKTNSYSLRQPSTGVESAPIDTSQSVPNQHHQSVSNQHLLIGVESAPQRYSMKVNNRSTFKGEESFQSAGKDGFGESLTLNSDPLLIAVATVDGSDPSQITRSGRDTAVSALDEIRTVCPSVTTEEVKRRAGNYAQHFKAAALTPTALARHWARCEKPPSVTTSQPHEAPLKKVYDINS